MYSVQLVIVLTVSTPWSEKTPHFCSYPVVSTKPISIKFGTRYTAGTCSTTIAVTQFSDVHDVLAHTVLLEDVSVTAAMASVNNSISCGSTIS